MQSERPKTYKKGPDVMSKSEHTQRRHAQATRGQGRLTGFGFKAPSYPVKVVGVKQPAKPPSMPAEQPIAQPPSPGPIEMVPESPVPGPLRVRSSSVLSDLSTANEAAAGQELADVDENESDAKNRNVPEADMNEDESEDWESKLEEGLQGPKSHIHDWSDLQTQIKDHLKKNSKTLPLSQVNQLLIILNFATLHLKGFSRTHAGLKIAQQWHKGQGNWFA